MHQFITPEQILQVILTIKDMTQHLFSLFFMAALQNVIKYGTANWIDVVTFYNPIANVLIFIGSIVLIYRLVLRKPLMTIKSIFDK